MTDAVKKTTKKATSKTKAPTKSNKNANGSNGLTLNTTNGHSSNVTRMRIPHDQIAMLAHRYWSERGRQHGHHEEDWFRAEQELRGKAS